MPPEIEVVKTGYGLFYIATRDVAEDGLYLRIAHYVMPAQQMRGSFVEMSGEPCRVPKFDGHIWVPIDDHNCWVYNWMCGADENVVLDPEYCEEWETIFGRGKNDLIPGPGFRLKSNPDNDYFIDREAQKTKSFTGIEGFNTQDFALQENMGIVDRSLEHLGTTDRAIIAMRQQLLEAVDDVAAGRAPKGSDPASYRDVRPADGYMPRDRDWREYFGPKMLAIW